MRGEPREAGHKAGSAAVRRVVRAARRLGVDALTLYAFSEQNWARPAGRGRRADGAAPRVPAQRARRDPRATASASWRSATSRRLPEFVRDALDPLAARRPRRTRQMTLALALSYGGARGDRHAARASLASRRATGRLDPEPIDGRRCWPRACRASAWASRISSSAPAASSASRTSCSTAPPTPSWRSPTCCGPTSPRTICSRDRELPAARAPLRRTRRGGVPSSTRAKVAGVVGARDRRASATRLRRSDVVRSEPRDARRSPPAVGRAAAPLAPLPRPAAGAGRRSSRPPPRIGALELFGMTHPDDRVAQVTGVALTLAVLGVLWRSSARPRALLALILAAPARRGARSRCVRLGEMQHRGAAHDGRDLRPALARRRARRGGAPPPRRAATTAPGSSCSR